MGNASAFDMDALDTRIRELVAYARERDGEDRTLLFRNLVDLFLTGKAPKKQPTRDQLLDVIEALVPHVEPDARRTVAELVANMWEPPVDLACRLAKDRPHLVGDLLRSTAFGEADIIELIGSTGRDHHHVIASRNDLSANVWIALARAAPAAPPFDNQSTLALWRDDLGLMHDGNDNHTVTPFRNMDTANQDGAAHAADEQHEVKNQPGSHAPNNSTDSQTAPTQQPADQRHPAQLRILRTDKDLIADRIEKSTEAMQTDASLPAEAKSATSDTKHDVAPVEPSVEPSGDAIVSSYPSDGSWTWRSDRDGLVNEVSPSGLRIYDRSVRLIGATILDMLGLNTKLGHPVSRAFQRRSTIHDAPLTLEAADDANRFWTLEARPLFSSNGGIFEGYEGVMTPVAPAGGLELHTQDGGGEPSALFYDDAEEATKPAAGKDTITDESIDRTIVPAPVENEVSPSSGNLQEPATSNADPLSSIAANMIRDMIGESIAEVLGNLSAANVNVAPHSEPEPQKATAPPAPGDDGGTTEPAKNNDEIAATLHILEQALSTLVISGQTANNSSLRLQTEIATACLKTLKEQMGASGGKSGKKTV